MTAVYFGLMVFCNIFFIYVFFGSAVCGEPIKDSLKESKIAVHLGVLATVIILLCGLM